MKIEWQTDAETQTFYRALVTDGTEGDPTFETRIWYEREGHSWCWYVSHKYNSAEGSVYAGEQDDDADEPEGLERAQSMVMLVLAALAEHGHPA